MKKLKTAMILMGCICLLSAGCTENQRARQFGGTANETIPAGQKLLVATWKQDNLWLLTRPMKAGETPETYEFRESSSFGVMQGKVIIKESK